MVFLALLIGLMAPGLLANPYHSFLHEVPFPGGGAAVDKSSSPALPTVSPLTADGAKSPIKERDGTLENEKASQTQSSSPAAPVKNAANSSITITVVEVSHKSPGNSDYSYKERLRRSIIEKADVDEKSSKCNCPSGRCSGGMCGLMDATPTPSTASLGNKRAARSVPEQILTSPSVTSAANINVTPGLPDAVETKAPVPESHIQHIYNPAGGVPEETSASNNGSPNQDSLSDEVSTSADLKEDTLNEREIFEDPEPSTNEQAGATIQSNARDQMAVHRQRRWPQEFPDDLSVLDEEVAPTVSTTTLKMAPDTPDVFQMEPKLIERSRRLYARSVERASRQAQADPAESTRKVQGSAVSPSITISGANTDEVLATGGGASVSAQVPAVSSNVPVTKSGLDAVNATTVELPKDTLPGAGNVDSESVGVKLVRSVDSAEVTSSTPSTNANQVLTKGIAEQAEAANETRTTPDDDTNTSAQPEDHDEGTGFRHQRRVWTKDVDTKNSSVPKTDDASNATSADAVKTVKFSKELPKQGETVPLDKNATEPADASRHLSSNKTDDAIAVDPAETATKATLGAVNNTEPATNSTAVSANATKISESARRVAANATEVSKNATGASANATAISANSTTVSANRTVSVNKTNSNRSSSLEAVMEERLGKEPIITHRQFLHPTKEIGSTSTSSRDEKIIKAKEAAAKIQEDRRLGDSQNRKDDTDFGDLDVRTLGGNQLDIDPVDLDRKEPKSKIKEMNQQASSSYRLSSAGLPQVSLLSYLLTSLYLLN